MLQNGMYWASMGFEDRSLVKELAYGVIPKNLKALTATLNIFRRTLSLKLNAT